MPTTIETELIVRGRIKDRGKPALIVRQDMSTLGFIQAVSRALDEIDIRILTNHEDQGTCCLWHAFMDGVRQKGDFEGKIEYLKEFFNVERR